MFENTAFLFVNEIKQTHPETTRLIKFHKTSIQVLFNVGNTMNWWVEVVPDLNDG